MQTGNTQLLDPKENRKYYSKSDQNFMDISRCTMAHHFIDRVRWLVEGVHKIDSRTHIAVGCKDGYEVVTLQSIGVESIGIDPSEDSIDEARLKANQLGFDGMEMFKVGFGEDIPEGISADSVSCMEVIEHVVDPDKLVSKLASIGTYVFISTPDVNGRHGMEDSKRNPEHVRLYSQQELEELVSKYGTIISSTIRDGQLCIMFKSKLI